MRWWLAALLLPLASGCTQDAGTAANDAAAAGQAALELLSDYDDAVLTRAIAFDLDGEPKWNMTGAVTAGADSWNVTVQVAGGEARITRLEPTDAPARSGIDFAALQDLAGLRARMLAHPLGNLTAEAPAVAMLTMPDDRQLPQVVAALMAPSRMSEHGVFGGAWFRFDAVTGELVDAAPNAHLWEAFGVELLAGTQGADGALVLDAAGATLEGDLSCTPLLVCSELSYTLVGPDGKGIPIEPGTILLEALDAGAYTLEVAPALPVPVEARLVANAYVPWPAAALEDLPGRKAGA